MGAETSVTRTSFLADSLAGRLKQKAQIHWRKLAIATAIVIILHILFLWFVAPELFFRTDMPSRTEVVQISPAELAKMKQRIMQKRDRMALAPSEVREDLKTEEIPKDAKMLGPQNQIVPKETIAGPQAHAPQDGGGSTKTKQQEKVEKKKLDLAKIGLGNKVPKPATEEEIRQQQKNEAQANRQGPPGPHTPRGLEDKNTAHGEDNLLNAIKSPFYSYLSRIEEQVVRNAYFLYSKHGREVMDECRTMGARSGQDFWVGLELTIDRQGNFTEVQVVKPSGISRFDSFMRQAFLMMGSAPHPPQELFEGKEFWTMTRYIGFQYVDDPRFRFDPY